MRTLLPVSIAILVAAIIGCGETRPEGAHVAGMVTLDGAPISQATIVFRPLEQMVGKSIECQVVDGKYEVKQESGVFGTHRVEIYAHRTVGKPRAAGQEFALPPGQLPPRNDVQYLPEIYNRQSRLTFDIQPGENQANFELKTTDR